jgi:hypothetical protein
LGANSTGSNNTSFGTTCLSNNTTGSQNTAVGAQSLPLATTANSNTAVGFQSLLNNTTGSFNTAIGINAGHVIANGNPNQTGSNSIFIGVDTRPLANGQANQIVIGNNAIGHGSNTVTLGNSSIVTTILRGNVGIGVIPSSWSLFKVLQGFGGGSLGFRTNAIELINNATYDGSNFIYLNTGTGANRYNVSDGDYIFNTAPSGTAGNVISFTERMRITSGGNVGIGTTSPSANLHIKSSSGSAIFRIEDAAGNALGRLQANAGDGNINLFEQNGYALTFGTSNTERMRITSGGDVLVGTSTNPGSGNYKFAIEQGGFDGLYVSVNQSPGGHAIRANRNGDGDVIFISRSGTNVGSISVSGALTSYNTSSDYRLKQDFKSFNGLDLVSKIKVYDYEWKSDNSRMNGVIAHELQEVVPYAVTGEKDAEEMQQVDYSKLVPILVQAIQELKSEIEILKNK